VKLTMENVLILGATSGIGKSMASYFGSQGANLILAGRDKSELNLIARDIELRYAVIVHVLFFEALDFKSHEDFFKDCLEIYPSLDGVFLSYGYMVDQEEAAIDFDSANKMMNINYNSPVSILNIIANHFEEQGKGFICVISSVAGDRGRQSNYIYGSSKAALSVYLQGLRNRLSKSNVFVITVKPGFVDTQMTYGILKDSPLVAKPEQVSKSIYQAIQKKKDVAYTPAFWEYIMLIIKNIPEKIFKRMSL
jgi:decaprenylphospho-beta-D-erythro-pentofuranosid-2-ulose 2-reductase